MHKLYFKLIKKIIILFIITFLPLVFYLYLNEEVHTTFMSNTDTSQCKYILDAEFIASQKSINISQKVIFLNKTNKNMSKIYFYFNNKKTKIFNITINNKESYYKVIGNDNILMIISQNTIEPNETIEINIDYLVDIKNKEMMNKDKVLSYQLNSWYPLIIYHDKNGWDLKNAMNNYQNVLKGNHYIRIFIPKDYKIITTNINKEKAKIKHNKGFYHIEEINIEYLPITIKK